MLFDSTSTRSLLGSAPFSAGAGEGVWWGRLIGFVRLKLGERAVGRGGGAVFLGLISGNLYGMKN